MIDFDHPRLNVHPSQIKEMPKSGEGNVFTCSLTDPGHWRLSYVDCKFYSAIILNCGAWGFFGVYDGTGRLLFCIPSAFTGSFVLEGYAEKGLIIDNGYGKSMATNVVINWTET